jgi:hypothetical protein
LAAADAARETLQIHQRSIDLHARLTALYRQLQELEMFNDALSQLAQCEDQMCCPHCGGMGCKACMGPPGMGLGRGRGKGDRPEAEDKSVDFVDTRPPMKIDRGAALIVGEVEGLNLRGNVQQELAQQIEQARRQSADPVTVQHLPRGYKDHTYEYLNRLREGE